MVVQQKNNLFKKGESGNPKGRRLGSFSLVAILKKKLQEIPEGKKESYAHYLIKKMLTKAIEDGDTSMIKDIMSRIDGMPKQSMDVTSDGKPIPILGGISVSGDQSNSQDSQT